MALTPQQKTTLKAAVLADATAAAYLAAGDMYSLAAYCNAATTTDAWRDTVAKSEMIDEITISSFDNLTAGKRDAFRLMLDIGYIDATLAKKRNGLASIFTVTGTYTDAAQIGKLAAICVEKAKWFEVALGFTTPAAFGGVTAIKRNMIGTLTIDDVSDLPRI